MTDKPDVCKFLIEECQANQFARNREFKSAFDCSASEATQAYLQKHQPKKIASIKEMSIKGMRPSLLTNVGIGGNPLGLKPGLLSNLNAQASLAQTTKESVTI